MRALQRPEHNRTSLFTACGKPAGMCLFRHISGNGRTGASFLLQGIDDLAGGTGPGEGIVVPGLGQFGDEAVRRLFGVERADQQAVGAAPFADPGLAGAEQLRIFLLELAPVVFQAAFGAADADLDPDSAGIGRRRRRRWRGRARRGDLADIDGAGAGGDVRLVAGEIGEGIGEGGRAARGWARLGRGNRCGRRGDGCDRGRCWS